MQYDLQSQPQHRYTIAEADICGLSKSVIKE